MQCEATGESLKGRCSSLVLLISLAQHWLCLVVSHRVPRLQPKIPSAPLLRQMLDKNPSTILRLPLCAGADSPDTQDTLTQQHGGNSMSNSTSLTQVQPGRTRWPCVEPQILCTLDVHAPVPGVQCRLLSYLCTQLCSHGDGLHSPGHTLALSITSQGVTYTSQLLIRAHCTYLQTVQVSATYQTIALLYIQNTALIRSGPIRVLSVILILKINF